MITPKFIRPALVLLLLICIVIASGVGAMAISPWQVIAILANKIGIHLPVSYTEGMENVLLQIRLPRILLAVLVGSGLAVAGASLQGLFRNPMADPILIGISSGASLAAILTLVCLGGLGGFYLLNTISFIGACVSSLVVFKLARQGGRTLVAMLLLAGLAVNALCNACTGLITYVANNEQLRSVTFWLMGSLGGASWSSTLSLLPFIIIPVLLLPSTAKALNAWSLGEREASHLGIDVRRLKIRVMVLATLAVGASVAISGIIGFVGLIVPHIIRSLSGNDHRNLIPDSALFGASLLVLADLVSRTLLAPAELPIGIITSALGTPLFIFLLFRYKRTIGTSGV